MPSSESTSSPSAHTLGNQVNTRHPPQFRPVAVPYVSGLFSAWMAFAASANSCRLAGAFSGSRPASAKSSLFQNIIERSSTNGSTYSLLVERARREVAGVDRVLEVEAVDVGRDVLEEPLLDPVRHVDDVGREQVGQAVRPGRRAHLGDVVVVRHDRELDLVLVRLVVRVDEQVGLLLEGRARPEREGRAVVDALGAGVGQVARGFTVRGAGGHAGQQCAGYEDAGDSSHTTCGAAHGLSSDSSLSGLCEPGCCGTPAQGIAKVPKCFSARYSGHSGYVKSGIR